jgi:hypothetical protein
VIRSQLSVKTLHNGELTTGNGQLLQAPNAVKKIITNPNPNSPSAANSLHTTLYHCFPTTDQLS